MPYKDKDGGKKYYAKNKEKWKNADGTWKRVSYYGTEEYKEKRRLWYDSKRAELNEKARIRARRRRPVIHGECPICGEVSQLVRDHNHTTGRRRDNICSYCNLGLGHVKENIGTLNSMIKYLERHNGCEKV